MNKNNIKIVFLGFIGALCFHVLKDNFLNTAQAKKDQIITANGINLVDKNGKIRAQLGFSKEGPPGFWIMDDKGTARIVMGLYPDQTAHFGLQDKNGLMIELMRSIGAQESPLLIFKNKGQDRMITGLNAKESNSFLVTYDKKNERKMHFGNYDGP